MQKGYAVTKVNNKIIKSVSDVKIHDQINVDLVDGTITANVTDIKEEK